MDETILMRAMAGEWDQVLVNLFEKYREANVEERKGLHKVITSDLRQMRTEGQPDRVVELYTTCSDICFRNYPLSP